MGKKEKRKKERKKKERKKEMKINGVIDPSYLNRKTHTF